MSIEPSLPTTPRNPPSNAKRRSSSRSSSHSTWRSSINHYIPSPLSAKVAPSIGVTGPAGDVSSSSPSPSSSGSPSMNSIQLDKGKAHERLLSISSVSPPTTPRDSPPHQKRQRMGSTSSITSVKSLRRNGPFTVYSEEPNGSPIPEEDGVAASSSLTIPTPPTPESKSSSLDVPKIPKAVTEPSPAEASPVPFPTSSSPPPDNSSNASRSGWFSSLSRGTTKGKGKAKERTPLSSVAFSEEDKPSAQIGEVATSPSASSTITSASAGTVTMGDGMPTPTPSSVAAASGNVTPTPVVQVLPATPPQPIPSTTQTPQRRRTAWFSSTTSSTPRTASPSTSPPNQRSPLRTASSAHSIPSSLDEEVPPLPPAPSSPMNGGHHIKVVSAIHPELKVDDTDSEGEGSEGPKSPGKEGKEDAADGGPGTTRKRTLSSLNPSTSRFSLSLPLFGSGNSTSSPEKRKKAKTVEEPKVPNTGSPESVPIDAAEAPSTTHNNDTNTSSSTATPADSATLATSSDPPTMTTQLPPPDLSIQEDTLTPRPSDAQLAQGQGQGTWWAYLGWSSAAGPPASNSESNPETQEATAQDLVSQSQDASKPDADTNVDASSSAPSPPSSDSPPPKDVESPTGKDNHVQGNVSPTRAKSVLSQETVTSTSAWYAPWSWYQAGEALAEEPTTGGEGGEGNEGGKTQAEIVKEEALKRDRERDGGEVAATEGQSSDSERERKAEKVEEQEKAVTKKTSAGGELNPISMSSSASGWASFFSRSVVGGNLNKAVTDGKPGEMEVMDLDEDDEQPGHGSGDSAVPATTPKATKALKALTNGNPEDSRSSSAPPAVTEPKDKNAKTPSTSPAATPPQNRKRKAPKLIVSEDVKKEVAAASAIDPRKRKSSAASTAPVTRTTSPTPSKSSSASAPIKQPKTPPPPNLVLPTWSEIFHTEPRSIVPPRKDEGKGRLGALGGFVKGVLFNADDGDGRRQRTSSFGGSGPRSAGLGDEEKWRSYGLELPRAFDVVDGTVGASKLKAKAKSAVAAGKAGASITRGRDALRECRKAVIIGVHGWFPGAMMRSVLGEPTGTSSKFVSMMAQALDDFQEKHKVKFESIVQIPLEGEGTIEKRVEKLYAALTKNDGWMSALREADVIFVATHSQGSIVSTHLLDRLYRDGHIVTRRSSQVQAQDDVKSPTTATPTTNQTFTSPEEVTFSAGKGKAPNDGTGERKFQRVLCLALCGIHLGPLRYLSSSSAFQGYIQYFESTAARELFEFQNTESKVSQDYVKALENVLDHETKMVYVASLNDQVVPIYSGLFTTASHPLILRALYIDGDAYNQYDYISNLLVLLIKVMNSGISDSGLLAHLSEATAGSLNGIGHSTAYEEIANFHLAVDYMFLTNEGLTENHPSVNVEPFNAALEQNDYEIPWSLRDLIADERVARFYSEEILDLRDSFRDWHPKTTILRDVKRKLQPLQRLPPTFNRHAGAVEAGSSKL